jgi:zinc protease
MISLRAAFLAFFSLLLSAPAPTPADAQTGVQARTPTGAPDVAPSGDGDWLYRGSDIARDPAWHFGTLPNGLRYAVRRNALPAGQVSIRIRIDAGSLHERDNERGWAHFVEHMMFRGTEHYPDHQARQIWQQLGASSICRMPIGPASIPASTSCPT